MASCSACHAPVIWAESPKGKTAPVNVTPDPNGNVVLDHGGRPADPPRYRVLTKAEIAAMNQGDLFAQGAQPTRYTLHFATCPKADQFRRCGRCHRTPCECKR